MDNDNKNTSNTQGDKDLQSLISNAIENRKILDVSNSNGPTGVIPIPSKEQQKADPIHESDPKQDLLLIGDRKSTRLNSSHP